MSTYLEGSSHRYGDRFVYLPLMCATGNGVVQPDVEQLKPGTAYAFTPDFRFEVDMRGALDAPHMLPYGGVRAHQFGDAAGSSLLLAHVYRDGWHS